MNMNLQTNEKHRIHASCCDSDLADKTLLLLKDVYIYQQQTGGSCQMLDVGLQTGETWQS